GFDGRITELTDFPQPFLSPTSLLAPENTSTSLASFLDKRGIESITLSGWSMGAYLAMDFALAFPKRVSAVYLLSARQSWPKDEIEAIRAELADDPTKFMKSFYRKCFLGYKGAYRKFLAELEEQYLNTVDLPTLEAGLSYLESFPMPEKGTKLGAADFPVYLLQGEKDIIAPHQERAEIPGASVKSIRTAGHPVFLDESCTFDWHRKKESIRRKFSRSAPTYDEHAIVQKEIAERLVEMLPDGPGKILETGCGTGNFTRLLRKRYPSAQLTALDFAEQMVTLAQEKMANDPACNFHSIDAEVFLSESHDDYDLITSNATMHWFDDLAETSRLISERLTKGGSLICSIFGPETMQEMQEGLQAIHGRKVPVPSSFFPAQGELQEIFGSLFATVEIAEWQIVRRYPSLTALLRQISKTGTAGWHPGQPLLNRHHLTELEQWFADNHDGCRISYQVFMVKCGKQG
ncbi:MAG: alpha/beta fold hydrolase, partial [Thermodesulfobacteriota bacterium]